jgi:hypothetical protein
MTGRVGGPAAERPALWRIVIVANDTVAFDTNQAFASSSAGLPVKRYRHAHYDGKSVSRTACGGVALRQKTE